MLLVCTGDYKGYDYLGLMTARKNELPTVIYLFKRKKKGEEPNRFYIYENDKKILECLQEVYKEWK